MNEIEYFLCLGCEWFYGDDVSGCCDEYVGMPLKMFKRKKKCKYFQWGDFDQYDIVDGFNEL